MPGARALAGAACVLLCALGAAAGQLSAKDRDTCMGALDLLRGCSPGMVPHDLQQHCCIPFHALEGMGCFCDDALVTEAQSALAPAAVAGLSACGVAGPLGRLSSTQDACPRTEAATAGEEAYVMLADDGDEYLEWGTDDGSAWGLPAGDAQVDPVLYLEVPDEPDLDALDTALEQLLLASDTPEEARAPEEATAGSGVDVRLGGSDVFSMASGNSTELALWDGVLSIAQPAAEPTTDLTISDGVSQITVSVPDDMDIDVDIILDEGDTLVVATGQDSTSVFNADFADVGSMVQLIGGWMSGLLAGGNAEQDRMDRGDASDAALVGGLSRLLAEILARLESGLGAAPLDVEISYELEDDESLGAGETEIDIEIDPELAPALTPQFLDQRLLALSRSLNRPVLPSPVRVGDVALLEAERAAPKQAPALRNCFNTGVCAWLCAHRAGLQWALGLETLALLTLLAFYARLNRAAARERGIDGDDEEDQASLKVPLIVHAADYAAEAVAQQQSPLWALGTKVSFEKP